MGRITFINGIEFKKALEVLSKLTDSQLETSERACIVLKRLKLIEPLNEIESMSQDEWDDFVTNNLEDQNETP